MAYSPAQFAEKTGFHRTTVQNWIKTGKLEATKNASGYWEISEQTTAKFMNQWSDESEEEAARHIGKQYILDQIEAEIQQLLHYLRHDLKKGLTASEVKEENLDLYERYVHLRKTQKTIEAINIPSAVQVEYTEDSTEEETTE